MSSLLLLDSNNVLFSESSGSEVEGPEGRLGGVDDSDSDAADPQFRSEPSTNFQKK